MKWQAALAGALASALMTSAASADVRIVNDPGGEVSAYVSKYNEMRARGQHVVIDGPCLSACTLLTGIIPRDQVCVTRRAVLGFHAASYYDDASRSLVPTRSGSRLVMRLLSAANPVLDRSAWRADAAAHNAARQRAVRPVSHLPVSPRATRRSARLCWQRRAMPLSAAEFRLI